MPWDVLSKILTRAESDNGSVAVVDRTATLTYPELIDRAELMAAALRDAGVGAGDRVAVRTTHSCGDVVSLLAAMSVDATVVPYDSEWPSSRRRAVVEDAGASVELLEGEVVPVALRSSRQVDTKAMSALALLMYTSGSTGIPRGVMLAREQIEFCLEMINERLRYSHGDHVLSPIRLSFDYGLYQMLLSLSVRATLFLCNPSGEFGWFQRAVEWSSATVLALTPSLARLATVKSNPLAMSNVLRLVTLTGEPVDRSVLERIASLAPNAGIVTMYGITECKRVSISEPNEWKVSATSSGTPLRDTEVVIRDGSGRTVSPGTVGRIHVRGPHLAVGYWRDPISTSLKFPTIDGVRELDTEDLGMLDLDGRIHVVGRLGDGYKERGHRVSVAEIEVAARSCAGVEAAVCVPPHEAGRSTLFAVCGDDVSRATLIEHMASFLGTERLPQRFVRLAAIPLTSNGKPDRATLRALARDDVSGGW
ncbi:class I adenylate-forming enzyme family protein [Promicromonospora kroppenstedtii]|uniref:class I adenylate-forming enzyme family protein n=1 Tax=Promicromonospora kroppenstedtii TaxID=440482 RepID=UPI000A02FC3D|nr:AMP-binding protein [Promicromonospora kroppenstedtii]